MRVAAQTITCPYCWQAFEIGIDLSADEQQYIEDCYVCCRPIVIRYVADGHSVLELSAEPENG